SVPYRRPRLAAPGVAIPLSLAGPLHEVQFVAPGDKSVYGILDCRMLLALDDIASVLAEHDVVRVQVDNFYRPRAHLGRGRKLSQHALGLAMDVVSFTLRDTRTLVVARDWGGALGEQACGPEAHILGAADSAIALRNVVCAVARGAAVHHIL